ncbi:MAG: peptide ABC transporter substrate-binding protein [Victivallaceae bacterium]
MSPRSVAKFRYFRTIAEAALLSIALTVSSCSSVKPNASQKISLAMQEDPLSLDPRQVRLVSNITLVKHLFEGLMREGSETEPPQPALIEEYFLSEDQKTYTFKLKKSFWHNGDPVTAYDFKDSWIQLLSKDFPTIFGYVFDGIKGAKAFRTGKGLREDIGITSPNDATLIVELEHPLSYFLDLLTLPAFLPVHKSARSPHVIGIGTEPFVFNGAFVIDNRKPGHSLTLKKNLHYHDEHKVRLEKIEIKIIPDSHTVHLLFEKGILDAEGPPWGGNIPVEAVETLKREGVLHSFDVAGTCWLSINTAKQPFSNEKLRRALALSIDREAIVKYVLKENQKPAGSVLPGFRQITVDKRFGLEIIEARTLLKEALKELGITKEDLSACSLIYSSSSYRNALIAQTIQEQWRQHLGISLPLEAMDHKILNERRINGHYYITTADWIADFLDPMSFLSVFEKDSGLPAYSLKSPEFSNLVDLISNETDEAIRGDLIQKAERFLSTEIKVIPLYHHSFACALKKSVCDVRFSHLGTMDFRYAGLSNPH